MERTATKCNWKLLVFLCWLLYTSMYLGRYSYSANITNIISDYGVTRASAGLVTTFYFFSYGAGQIVNGLLSKRYNKRYVLAGVLIVSAVLNVVVYAGIPFTYIKYLWLINGFVQSITWSSVVYLFGEYVPVAEHKQAVFVMTTGQAVGTLLMYGMSAAFEKWLFYKLVFLIGAIIMAVSGIAWFVLYKRATAGGKVEDEETPANDTVQTPKAAVGKGLFVLISVLAVFAIIKSFIKDGLTTWVPSILKESYGLTNSLSILLTVFLPLIGIFGSFLSVLLSKKIPNHVVLATLGFVLAGGITVGVVFLLHTPYWIVALLCFSLVECVMAGIGNVVVNMTPLHLKAQINAGFLAGLLDGLCYVGSTFSSYGLGKVADVKGWPAIFYLFLLVIAVAVLIGVVFCFVQLCKRARKSRE